MRTTFETMVETIVLLGFKSLYSLLFHLLNNMLYFPFRFYRESVTTGRNFPGVLTKCPQCRAKSPWVKKKLRCAAFAHEAPKKIFVGSLPDGIQESQEYFIFYLVGFKGNLSLLEILFFFFFSRGLKQMEVCFVWEGHV